MGTPARRILSKGLARSALVASMLALSAVATLPAHAANYTWNNVKIGGSGYVPAIIPHPTQQGLFYARTDVEGAYRYNSSTGTWIALNDWTPPSMGNNMGIESIAVDPNDARMLYMVAGSYYWAGNGYLLISSDQGNTFPQQVQLPFSTGANWSGRQVGERLQVDPNLGSILFYGSGNNHVNGTKNGLWKSTDSGLHWTQVTGFPALSNDDSGAGVSFVAFYNASGSKGSATRTIYAGINTKSAAASGAVLYKSVDGGNTWSAVWGGPSGLLPQRGQIGPDGYLYITFSQSGSWNGTDYYGPDGLTAGQVWKVNVASGRDEWSYITPPDGTTGARTYGFAGLSVDPNPAHAGTVTVNTIDKYPGETMFRTTDGGRTWTNILPNATLDTSAAPWTTTSGPPDGFGNWGGSALDPFDPNHAFITFGGGVWETRNLTAANTNWAFGENGIEETAVYTLISPNATASNYPVLSGNWDICGFTHASLTTAPTTQFSNPTCSRVTGLDYAQNYSAYVVRVEEDGWNNDPNKPKHYGAVSWDGGGTWYPFSSNGPTTVGGGQVTVNVDHSTILWSPPDVAPVYSNNNTWSWNSLNGVLPLKAKVAADGSNPSYFYAYDASTGKFYASGDKAVTWVDTGSNPVQYADQMVATPGKQGDLWIASWNGLYHTTSSGWGAWTKNSAVTVAKAIGFGKAAPGSFYPTIYMYGTINGVTAIYRSTDIGNTWLRINDDQHQWGGISTLTGDPKVFGTVYVGARGIIYGTSPD
jgi:hypothetical protein